MQAEHVEIDGKLICIQWPVSKVRLVNQAEVHYEDATGLPIASSAALHWHKSSPIG